VIRSADRQGRCPMTSVVTGPDHRPPGRLVEGAHHVTAALVSHDGFRWLLHVLDNQTGQRRMPDDLIAVDTGSTDGSGRPPGPGTAQAWVWLLHDDCAPAPDALEQLLEGVRETGLERGEPDQGQHDETSSPPSESASGCCGCSTAARQGPRGGAGRAPGAAARVCPASPDPRGTSPTCRDSDSTGPRDAPVAAERLAAVPARPRRGG